MCTHQGEKFMPGGDGPKREFLFILSAAAVSLLLLLSPGPVSTAEGGRADGNDLDVGPGFTYSTIRSALSAASPGDRIVVHPGVYNENLVLDRTVEIHGTDMNTTIIDGGGSTAMVIDAEGCVVSGLNITGGLPDGWSGEEASAAGIAIRSDRNEVFGCYFHDNYFGIYMKDSSYNWVHDSISAGNERHGIFLSGSSRNSFDNLICNDNGYNGFGFLLSSDNEFFYCRAEGNGVNGWEVRDSGREYVRFSTASENGHTGFRIDGGHDKNSLVNCYAAGNSRDGVWISSDTPQKVENCTIGGNSLAGIRLGYGDSPSTAVITGNLIMNNSKRAIEIDEGCGPSLIFGNDLVNNGKWGSSQATDNGTGSGWNNGPVGNHWSDWTTPDSDRDGIVDVPYQPSGSASGNDRYPRASRMTPHYFGQGIQPGPAALYGPHITQTVLIDAVAGEPYAQRIGHTDRDTPEDLLNWTLVTDSAWLEMNGDLLSGTPDESDVGTAYLTITVSDGLYLDRQSFTLLVRVTPGGPVERPGYGVIDIGGWENLTAGRVSLEAMDLTDGGEEFQEYRWTVDGSYRGSGPSITLDLEEGTYDIELRAAALSGEWYVISRPIDVGPAPQRSDGPGMVYYGILAASAVIGILIAAAVWGFYMRGKGKRPRTGPGRKRAAPPKDRGVAAAVRATDAGPEFRREMPVSVIRGYLPEERRTYDLLGKEETEKRGPVPAGPQLSIEEEYREIEREALSWKKTSRFTMDRGKMHLKLRRKFEEGEMDRRSFEELSDLIDSNMEGGGT
ncbi:MAG: right-handed parallel beta-helix repeat-containing protein [Thermoplasmatota archaeon]